ncbi:MAG: hypothetical protein UT62_C0024G0002 [Parcubacteria group bacterium GW2011_GWC1_39_8]|nr:MAG: hypothetical protein UT62_C0024G0002 [Parcubacteria group bacterium GW2011_GWC1_39_8]
MYVLGKKVFVAMSGGVDSSVAASLFTMPDDWLYLPNRNLTCE